MTTSQQYLGVSAERQIVELDQLRHLLEERKVKWHVTISQKDLDVLPSNRRLAWLSSTQTQDIAHRLLLQMSSLRHFQLSPAGCG